MECEFSAHKWSKLTRMCCFFFLFLTEIHRVKNNLLLSRWLCCHSVWQVRIDGIRPKIIPAAAKAWTAFPSGCPGFPWAWSSWYCGFPDVHECLWPLREPLCRGKCKAYLAELIFVEFVMPFPQWRKQKAGLYQSWVMFYFGWCSAVYSFKCSPVGQCVTVQHSS